MNNDEQIEEYKDTLSAFIYSILLFLFLFLLHFMLLSFK